MRKNTIKTQIFTEMVVGFFIIAILVGLGYFTIILSNDALFSKKQTINIQFEDIMGLSEGDNVVVRGMPVGKVDVLVLDPQKGITVTCKLNQHLTFYEDYSIDVVTTSILGGRYLEINPGSINNAEVSLTEPLQGNTPVDLMNNLTDTIVELKESLFSGGILDNIEDISSDLKAITEEIRNGNGTIGMLIMDQGKLYNSMYSGIESFNVIAKRLENGEGTIGKLLSSDSKMYDDLEATVASFKVIAQRLENGEGALGQLLSPNSQLMTDFEGTMSNINIISGQIADGKGTVGRLVMDDDMYIQLQSILGDAHSALDDWREMSPVTTFSSVFFGAF